MKRCISILMEIICILVLFCCAGYVLLALYYKDNYAFNTWVNGVYCTGRTAEEINAELLSEIEAPIVVLTDRNGRQFSIDLGEAGYEEDYTHALYMLQQSQNSILWFQNLFSYRKYTFEPVIRYEEERLQELWEVLPCVVEETKRKQELDLEYDAQTGYVLEDGLSDRLDIEKAYQLLKDAILQRKTEVELTDACYYDVSANSAQREITKLWSKIEEFQDCDLVYDMGAEEISFTAEQMAAFLQVDELTGMPAVDEAGKLLLDQTQIEAYIEQLADQYDTYQVERSFNSTRGDVVTVKGGTYGTKLDRQDEILFLSENLMEPALHDGTPDLHIPTYEEETPVRGLNDIGDTYIEVDMTDQMLYYYEEGELLLETAVVTGNTGRRMGTPEGVNYVYNKQKNRVLRGEGYASPVKFWMPVRGAIGIHDANWRSEFGGTIYQKSGSHGCINVPKEIMPDLYDMVEIGTPVILFY